MLQINFEISYIHYTLYLIYEIGQKARTDNVWYLSLPPQLT
nr:MAG TPA: hypothetical protein [Bacteriophage sp.]